MYSRPIKNKRILSIEERRDYCKKNNIILEEFEAGLENEIDCMNSYGVPMFVIEILFENATYIYEYLDSYGKSISRHLD